MNKRGTLFEGGRVQRSMLNEMAAAVNDESGAVPLHTLHQQGSELPVGRVFYAEVRETDADEAELRALFFVGAEDEDLVARLDSGTIDEVSIGAKPEKILCSECGFDYIAEGSFENLFTRTCDNDHTIGEEGVHARLSGLDFWSELSLVSRGAARKAKILSRAKQKLGREEMDRLAAHGFTMEHAVLVATCNQEEVHSMAGENKGGGSQNTVDLNAMVERQATLMADVQAKDKEISGLNDQLQASTAKVDELEGKVSELQTKLEEVSGEEATKLRGSLDEANGVIEGATAKLAEHYKAAFVALGKDAPESMDDVTLDDMIAKIEEAGVKLHQLVGAHGNPADAGSSKADEPKKIPSAFHTRK